MKNQAFKDHKFVLKRQAIRGKLDKSLILSGGKTFVAGALIGVTLFTLSACDKIDKGNYEDGFELVSTDWIEEINSTKYYYLIRIDGKVYLTMRLESYREVDSNGIKRYKYYDVKSHELVGVTLEMTDYKFQIESIVSSTLHDEEYFNGEYAYGKLIAEEAVVPLSTFIKSSKPSSEDISFWSENSLEAQQEFDNLVLMHKTIRLENKKSDKKESINFNNPLGAYECTKKDGEVLTLVGYRASMSEKDIGYNYVYNIFDGKHYYIGKSREDAFVSVHEEKLGEGFTIQELRDAFSVTIEQELDEENPNQYEESTEEVEENSKTDATVDEPVVENSEETKTLEEFDWQANAEKITVYRDVIVLHVPSLKLYEKNYTDMILDEKENYLFLVPIEDEGVYISLFDSMSRAFFWDDMSDLSYMGSNMNFFTDYTYDARESLSTFDDFLDSLGKGDMKKDGYTLADISSIREEVNPDLVTHTSPDDLVIVDRSQADESLPAYAIMKRSDSISNNQCIGYVSPEAPFEFCLRLEKNSLTHYSNSRKNIIAVEVNSMPLEDFLYANNYTSLIKTGEGYTETDILKICDEINGISYITNEKKLNFN